MTNSSRDFAFAISIGSIDILNQTTPFSLLQSGSFVFVLSCVVVVTCSLPHHDLICLYAPPNAPPPTSTTTARQLHRHPLIPPLKAAYPLFSSQLLMPPCSTIHMPACRILSTWPQTSQILRAPQLCSRREYASQPGAPNRPSRFGEKPISLDHVSCSPASNSYYGAVFHFHCSIANFSPTVLSARSRLIPLSHHNPRMSENLQSKLQKGDGRNGSIRI